MAAPADAAAIPAALAALGPVTKVSEEFLVHDDLGRPIYRVTRILNDAQEAAFVPPSASSPVRAPALRRQVLPAALPAALDLSASAASATALSADWAPGGEEDASASAVEATQPPAPAQPDARPASPAQPDADARPAVPAQPRRAPVPGLEEEADEVALPPLPALPAYAGRRWAGLKTALLAARSKTFGGVRVVCRRCPEEGVLVDLSSGRPWTTAASLLLHHCLEKVHQGRPLGLDLNQPRFCCSGCERLFKSEGMTKAHIKKVPACHDAVAQDTWPRPALKTFLHCFEVERRDLTRFRLPIAKR